MEEVAGRGWLGGKRGGVLGSGGSSGEHGVNDAERRSNLRRRWLWSWTDPRVSP